MSNEGFIKVSDNVSIPINEYANKANTILGIRGSGKTYTGTMFAEQLMDNNIPILVIDPIGVWHSLRYGVNGSPGYPIVVAGGLNADIQLTQDNVISIVDAALKEGVSLVIDLFGMDTATKSSWINIVSEVVHYLIYNNKKYKRLRHVFIEEASEFIPQRPGPGNAAIVYGRIESMTRMGRNCGIGVTFINQRAQEIAKSVFELCENVIIHQQNGKNSLSSVRDWLKLKGANSQQVIESLPTLEKGECWIITGNTETRTKVLPKKTLHPDPENQDNLDVEITPPDVSGFIERMKKIMQSTNKPTFEQSNQERTDVLFDRAFEKLKEENELLKAELLKYQESFAKYEANMCKIRELLNYTTIPNDIKNHQIDLSEESINKYQDINIKAINFPYTPPKEIVVNNDKKSGISKILNVIAMVYPNEISKVQIGLYCRMISTSGSFGTYIGNLKREGLIETNGRYVVATKLGVQKNGPVEYDWNCRELVMGWVGYLGGTTGKILECIANMHPLPISKEKIGEKLNLAITGGSFNTYLGTLKRKNLIIKDGNNFKLNPEFYF